MLRRTSLLAVFVLLISCSDMLLYRASGDYFPLVIGTEWKYLVGETTTYVQVVGDTSVGGRASTIVTTDLLPEFWLKEPTEVLRFYRDSISRGGAEHTLEQRFGLVYVLPLVVGNCWYDEFQDTIAILGSETLHYYHRLDVRVAGIEDLATPAGAFDQCYRLSLTEEIRDYDTTVVASEEWLAPGVGLVKRSVAGDDQVLVEYHIGP